MRPAIKPKDSINQKKLGPYTSHTIYTLPENWNWIKKK